MKRKHISVTTKLASALLALGDVPYDDAKQMTAEQIISLYAFDHGIRHSQEGTDEFWNLTPRLMAAHREKTRKVDIPEVAKAKRLLKRHEEMRKRMLAKDAHEKIEHSRWPSRRLQSRPFPKT